MKRFFKGLAFFLLFILLSLAALILFRKPLAHKILPPLLESYGLQVKELSIKHWNFHTLSLSLHLTGKTWEIKTPQLVLQASPYDLIIAHKATSLRATRLSMRYALSTQGSSEHPSNPLLTIKKLYQRYAQSYRQLSHFYQQLSHSLHRLELQGTIAFTNAQGKNLFSLPFSVHHSHPKTRFSLDILKGQLYYDKDHFTLNVKGKNSATLLQKVKKTGAFLPDGWQCPPSPWAFTARLSHETCHIASTCLPTLSLPFLPAPLHFYDISLRANQQKLRLLSHITFLQSTPLQLEATYDNAQQHALVKASVPDIAALSQLIPFLTPYQLHGQLEAHMPIPLKNSPLPRSLKVQLSLENAALSSDTLQLSGNAQAKLLLDIEELSNASLELHGTLDSLHYSLGNEQKIPFIHHGKTPASLKALFQFQNNALGMEGEINSLNLLTTIHQHAIPLTHARIKAHLNKGIIHLTSSWNLEGTPFVLTSSHSSKKHHLSLQPTTLQHPSSLLELFTQTPIQLSQGTLALEMEVNAEHTFLLLMLKDATLRLGSEQEAQPTLLTGIHTQLRLHPFAKNLQSEPATLRINKISTGDLSIDQFRMRYKLYPKGIQLAKASGTFLQGRFSLQKPCLIPFTKEPSFSMLWKLSGIQLEALSALFPDFGGSISGSISGFLPLKITKGACRLASQSSFSLDKNTHKAPLLRYPATGILTQGIPPGSVQYTQRQLVEKSLENLQLSTLNLQLNDSPLEEKAIQIRLEGRSPNEPHAPPIHLNINAFRPNDSTLDFFDLFLKHREQLDFGL